MTVFRSNKAIRLLGSLIELGLVERIGRTRLALYHRKTH